MTSLQKSLDVLKGKALRDYLEKLVGKGIAWRVANFAKDKDEYHVLVCNGIRIYVFSK